MKSLSLAKVIGCLHDMLSEMMGINSVTRTITSSKARTLTAFFITIIAVISACQANAPGAKIWYTSYHNLLLADGTSAFDSHIANRALDDNAASLVIQSPESQFLHFDSFSPDGEYLTYVMASADGVNHLWIAHSDGSNSKKIGQARYIGSIWLGDTQLLIVEATEIGVEREFKSYDIRSDSIKPVTMNSDIHGGCKQLLTSHQPEQFTFNSDNTFGLMHYELEGDSVNGVTDVIFDRTAYRNFNSGNCASFSRDRKKITFVGHSNLDSIIDDMFIASADAWNIERLTNFGENYDSSTIIDAELSPDGNWVIISGNLHARVSSPDFRTGPYIGLLDIRSKVVEFLSPTDFPVELTWSPDSHLVAVSLKPGGGGSDYGNNDIYVIDVITKNLKRLTFDGGIKEVIGWR